MFREELPDQCPPHEAVDVAYERLYRAVPADPPLNEHFDSHARLGKPKPDTVDDCRWASCSLFTHRRKATNVAKLPKLRPVCQFVAELRVDVGAGLSQLRKQHVDFWFYKEFDPCTAVENCSGVEA